ncbi:unnamed protein product, partial [Coregonus sp. 'balchen']
MGTCPGASNLQGAPRSVPRGPKCGSPALDHVGCQGWWWFSPMVLLYLSTVIPSIWFLELSLLQYKLLVNISSGLELEELLAHIPISAVGHFAAGPRKLCGCAGADHAHRAGSGPLAHAQRGHVPDQLSQLLMAYVGLGADILDIFDTFKEPEVKTNSWAIMQFPLVLTQTRPPKAQPQPGSSQPGSSQPGSSQWSLSQGVSVAVVERMPGAPSSCYPVLCYSSEVWNLLLTVGLQDGMFLVYRLYLMIRQNVLNQLMIFFTCKNILVVLLEVYRIFVVQCEQQEEAFLRGLETCAMPWCQQAQEEVVVWEEDRRAENKSGQQ